MKTDARTSKDLYILFGISLFVQAVTSLIAGAVLFEPFVSKDNVTTTMSNFAANISSIYGSVLLQIITALVIVVLGIAMYQLAGHINRTMAMIAFSFYLFEAILVAISQAFVFSLVKVSQLNAAAKNVGLENLGEILLTCRDFTAQIAIIPFGIGALLFYYLLMKANVIPKWLALWGLITVPFVLIGVPLMTFGITVPFALFVPYVPFEFFTGIYILIRINKMSPY